MSGYDDVKKMWLAHELSFKKLLIAGVLYTAIDWSNLLALV